MPFKRQGRYVLHLKGGKWKIKQRCKNAASAKRAIRLLHWKTGE